jgi:hypothetical protein
MLDTILLVMTVLAVPSAPERSVRNEAGLGNQGAYFAPRCFS